MKKEEFSLIQQRLQVYLPFLPPLLPPVPPGDGAVTKNTARALSAYALEKLFGLTTKVAAESVTDDFGDQGIDAVYYHQADRTLYLVQSKLKEVDAFVQADIQPFIVGVRMLLSCNDLGNFNANFQVRENELDQSIDDCHFIKLILAFTGGLPTAPVSIQIEQLLADKANVDERLTDQWIEYGPEKAYSDLLLEKAQEPVDKTLTLYGGVKVEQNRAAYYGTAKLADLADWYTKEGRKILEKNIRFSLGATNTDVNSAIYDTLKEHPSNFFFLNNGVTLLAREIHPMRGSNSSRKYGLKAVSIINGAQTVATASSYFSENENANRDLARVMVTLIKVDAKDEFGVAVAKARNTQNPVAASAFAALDSAQETLHRAMALMGWEYYYRPEAAEGVASAKSLRIDEVSEALALFHPNPNVPLLLKTEPSIFRTYGSKQYGALFAPERLSPRRAIVAALYAREILNRLDVEAGHQNNSVSHRAIYRHGKYAIAWILCSKNHEWLNVEEIPTSVEVAATVDVYFDPLRQLAVDEAESLIVDKGPLAFFRNATDSKPYIASVKAMFAAA
ncbi:MAG: AIPR family protein [Polaromonas sp.]|nr:AIPR family protein [Polaromonas sp.]